MRNMLAVKYASRLHLLSRTVVLEKVLKTHQIGHPRRSLHLATLRGVEAPNSEARALPLRALLVDAAGTLISPSETVAEVYLHYARVYGCLYTQREILSNFRRAFSAPWKESILRYVGDGRPFWRSIVAESTGCHNLELSESLYMHYARPEAWAVAPGCAAALAQIRRSGVKLAVVSNFDTRLRPLLEQLHLAHLFDTLVISAEVDAEKPNPLIFEIACQKLGVQPNEAVHVGDDRRNDITGARAAGCYAWLWGSDVKSFAEVGDSISSFNESLTDSH